MNYYLHIPFCRQKCPYCKFALTPVFTELKKRRYIEYLKREIGGSLRKELSEGNEDGGLALGNPEISIALSTREQEGIGTIYFGGGTPSILTLDEVRSILECFLSQNSYSATSQPSNTPIFERSNPEITFECNPEDITSDYVRGLLHLGINRISLGVQSLNNDTLKTIHRSDRENILQALKGIESAFLSSSERGSGISLNIDFILGLPFSKPGETLTHIRELHDRFPSITHTSVYMLEEGHYPKDWKGRSISEGEMREEYRTICEYFDSNGWHHYEISNWSKPGYESVHNRGYWNHTNTRGFGLSATSYQDGRRWTNASSFSGYYSGKMGDEEILSDIQIQMEKVIFGLRTFALDAEIFPGSLLTPMIENGELTTSDGKILLTPAGIFRENFIIGRLLDILPP